MSEFRVSEVPVRQGRRWHPLLAVPAVVVATVLLPPLGAGLAFWARWGKPARAVTVTLACVWSLVMVMAASGGKKEPDDAKSGPRPTVTVTATATVHVTATPTTVPASGPPVMTATPTPPAPVVPSPADIPKPTGIPFQVPPAPTGPGPDTVDRADDNLDDGKGSDPAPVVSYRNCSDVRAADAALIRRGDPGYGRHLDRDGDGVACE
ncbi:excalibur calcium-binding domain-containing protein [Streptomyces sp. NPDC097619]|uniref:excalibur calcium-binding domain-containing protein n=1 Tax=Streptomyces sp. NPDC097619 TaxID=3157228 RepID=UPI00332CD00F